MAGRVPRWRRLTHADAVRERAVRGGAVRESEVDDAIATYAVQTILPEDLPQRTHFFWTSGSLFRDALARWPEIADRWHASGPGRTSRVIRDARLRACGASSRQAGEHFRVFLDYDEWVKEILE